MFMAPYSWPRVDTIDWSSRRWESCNYLQFLASSCDQANPEVLRFVDHTVLVYHDSVRNTHRHWPRKHAADV